MEKYLVFITFLLFISACSINNESEFDLIITNVSLIDGTGKDIQSGVNVYIKGDTIARINRNEITQSSGVIDGSGKYLIPGLFDAHYHLQDVPNDTVLNSPSLKQLIHFGVTGVLIPGGSLASSKNLGHLKQLETTGEITTPHLFYTSLIAALEDGHPMKMYGKKYYTDSVNIHIVKDTNHIKSIVRQASEEGAVGIKIMIEDGPMPPFTSRMPQNYISTFSATGKEYGLPVFAHVSDMTEVRLGVKGGVDAFMHFMGVQIDWEEDQETIDRIVSDSVSWVTTAMLAKSFFYPLNKDWLEKDAFRVFEEDQILPLTDPDGELEAESRKILSRFLGSDTVPMETMLNPMMSDIKRLHDEGVNIVLGTDVGGRPYILPGISVHEEMQLLEIGGFTPEEIIKISSYNAAKMLGISHMYGSIEEGKIADMVLLNENPLESINNTLSINTVIKNGEVQERLIE